jgi:hypothetical protein
LAVHEIRRLVAALERTQFLMRRGRLVRVSPDVLADHLLYRAAVDENGNPTGFVDAMVASFRPSLENILANGAELDWRASATAHHESVLEAVWRDLLQLLPTFSNRQRAELVGQLKRAAIFAPADVLAMCEWLIGHPEAPTDELLTRWGLKDTSDKLNRALTDVVALIATHPDFTRRCATQLWKLAAQDDRPQNPHPDHPRRRLEDLVKYERSPGRDAGDVVQVQAIDFLISRLLDASRDKSAVWAVSALANALNRTGEANEWNRRTLTLGEFSLSSFLDQLADRRRAVVRCLKHLALEKKLDEAAAAIAELGALLRAPRGPFGRGLESSEIAVWQPEAEEGIATLQAIAQSAHSEVVRYLARRELRSAPQDHWPQIAPSLEHALEEIEPVLGERLYDLLLGVPWEEQLKDWPSEEARVGDISEAVAVAFWKQHQTPQAVVDVLLAALSAIQGTDRRGGNSQVGRLVYALVRTSPHGPRELIERLAAHEGGWHLLRPALIATHEKEPALAEALSSELSASEHEAVRANALDSVQWMLERAADLKALVALTKKLSQDASPDVRGAASRVLRRLAKHAPADAVDILASIDWSSELWLADAALGVLDARYGIDPTLLSDGHVDSLLTRIEQLHSLEGRNYEVLQFIAFASERRPRQTVEMLIRRIRAVDEHREDERNSDQWIPIPYNGHGLSLPGIRLASNQQELVGLIRDASLHAAGMVHFWLPVLFHAADPGLEAGRIILRDWITSGESEKIVGAASLLRGFDHSIVFVEHELISELIEAASRCGAECLRDASGELYAIAGSGVYTGAPGEPAPRHLHDKSESERLAQVYADREPVRGFYQSLVASAESNIRFDVALGGEEDE